MKRSMTCWALMLTLIANGVFANKTYVTASNANQPVKSVLNVWNSLPAMLGAAQVTASFDDHGILSQASITLKKMPTTATLNMVRTAISEAVDGFNKVSGWRQCELATINAGTNTVATYACISNIQGNEAVKAFTIEIIEKTIVIHQIKASINMVKDLSNNKKRVQ